MKTQLLSSLAVAVLMSTNCRAADLYRVSGVVVNSETGAPYPRAKLAVLRANGAVEARQITGPDGRFSFEMPAGMYSLRSGNSNDPQSYGRQTSDSQIASSIPAGPGQDNSNLVFRWFPPGAISGRVLDETGEPVEAALVQLVRSTVSVGKRREWTVAWTRTDDKGEYRFGPLPGSSYYLAVTGTPWYANRIPVSGQTESSNSYAAKYFPDSPELTHAAPLKLKPGEEARADFVVHTVSGVTVQVEVDAPVGLVGTIGLLMDGIGATDGFQREVHLTGPKQKLEAVPPGRYQVRVKGTVGSASFEGRSSIDVGSSNLDVKVAVKPLPAVSGAVRLKNPAVTPKGSILVALEDQDKNGGYSAAMRSDGSFSFTGVPPGRFRVVIRGTDGYFASDVHVDGAASSDGVVDLLEGAAVTLRIIASDDTGRVGGFVTAGDQKVEGAMVILSPAAETRDSNAYRAFQTERDGSYDIKNVRSGDYMLFAVEDTSIEYKNPNIVRPYFESAKRVHVERQSSFSENIPLVKLPLPK